MYSLIYSNNKHKNTAKGVSKTIIKKKLRHEHYRKCLFNNEMKKCEMKLIRSEKHQLYMEHVVKTGLCNFDDKRYIKRDGISSFAYANFRIENSY